MANVILSFSFTALRLSERSSRVAFDTKIQIMVLSDELKEALELLDESRMIDPEVRWRLRVGSLFYLSYTKTLVIASKTELFYILQRDIEPGN